MTGTAKHPVKADQATDLTPGPPGTLDFVVKGMTCGSCAHRVQRTLRRQPGVAGAEVNFATATAHVVLDVDAADAAALEAALVALRKAASAGK